MRKTHAAFAAAVIAGVMVATALPAGAAATQTLALWNLNERAGSTVLQDSSGHGISGTIGSHVVSNGSYENFPYVPGGDGGLVDPQHLDLVNSSLLNPGTRDYSVTFRLKFTLALGNPMQKGQTGRPADSSRSSWTTAAARFSARSSVRPAVPPCGLPIRSMMVCGTW